MKYDLVFEGGGAKGMSFVGALKAFLEAGHTFDRLMGTSAGAIMATFLAAGYSTDEMVAALGEQQLLFPNFLQQPGPFAQEEIDRSFYRQLLEQIDIPFLFNRLEERLDQLLLERLLESSSFRHLFSLTEKGGWYAADNFLAWIQRNLDEGMYRGRQRRFSHMTMAQFFDVTQTPLTLVAADTTASRLLILNHHTAPDCPLVWAVRMSMSVPLLWQEVLWQPEWGTYLGQDISGHQVVDGGLLSNFPIELFVSDQAHVTAAMGAKTDAGVMGLLIDETLAVPGVSRRQEEATAPSIGLGQMPTLRRLRQLVDTVTQAHDKMVMDAFADLVVRLPALGFGTTEFDMTEERRTALLNGGMRAMSRYLASAPADSGSFTVMARKSGDEGQRARGWADRVAGNLLAPLPD